MKLHISKLDAAKRQLETALQFFLRNGDPVSTHTLVGAVHQILEDIANYKGITSLRRDVLARVKEEYKDEITKKLNVAKNFFKHADKDPDGILEFNLESTPLMLLDACRMYTILTSESVPLIKIFNLWHYANYPESLILSDQEREIYNNAIKGLDPTNRGAFLNLLPLLENSHYKF